MFNEKSKTFWQKYSEKKDLSYFSLMNLQTDPRLAQQKFYHELKIVLDNCDFLSHHNVLDLGGGVGLWSKAFSSLVNSVTLVEREPSFVEKAHQLLEPLNNCKIIESDSCLFRDESSFDIVFMSGLTIYLDDSGFENMLNNVKAMTTKDSLIVHRDAYGVKQRFLLEDKLSTNLGEKYSAQYRSRVEYDELFRAFGWEKVLDIDMYPDDKRWIETDLRLAKYKKI